MNTASLAPEKPLRFACNRCHSLKLRCPRSSELDKSGPDEPCSRCRKAGAACIVSERGKVGRPAKRKATPPTPAELVEVSNRQDHHRELRKSSTEGTSLMHVFGLGDSTLQQSQLTPPESLDHSLKCDPDSIMSGNGSPDLTPLNRQTSRDMDGVDPHKIGWGTDPAWPDGTLDADPNNFPGPEAVLYEPFPHDIDIDIDLPTFQFPHDTTSMFNMPGTMTGMKDKDNDQMFPTMFQPRSPNKKLTPKRRPPPPPVSISEWSSTTCLLKLSDLSSRMLRASEKYRSSTPTSANSELCASSGNRIVKETVDFSGELIDVARQTLPRVFNASSQCDSTLGTEVSTPTAFDGDDSTVASGASSVGDWINVDASSPAPSMPESAVIFLLLGCYTQLLYSFELAIDCLYAENKDPGRSDMAVGGNLSNINSMLKASLSVQTVTYLLGRVHKAFTVGEPDSGASEKMRDDEYGAGSLQSWKKSLMGNKDIDEGLLGRTFNEIQDREQRLMKKAQQLKQMINRFQM